MVMVMVLMTMFSYSQVELKGVELGVVSEQTPVSSGSLGQLCTSETVFYDKNGNLSFYKLKDNRIWMITFYGNEMYNENEIIILKNNLETEYGVDLKKKEDKYSQNDYSYKTIIGNVAYTLTIKNNPYLEQPQNKVSFSLMDTKLLGAEK